MRYRLWQELSDEDFRNIGFKCGLETHQQLLTDQKLFCQCHAVKKPGTPDAEILRHMRPTLSELGVYDGAALMEYKTKKDVVYQLFKQDTCTYEMDDTPPFHVNEKALDIGIIIAKMLNCSIVDEIHISRKQYLDGSIPTGFQRTAIIGVEGWLPLGIGDRKIRIIQLAVEEDSCREISDHLHTITFRTDRLSWPLIESVTYPDMHTPTEAAIGAWQVGRLLRSSYLIRRGIGSVRQDVNVSVTGGTRIEIKGVPKIPFIPSLTANEALRQKSLLELIVRAKDLGLSRDIIEQNWRTADVTEKVKSNLTSSAPDSILNAPQIYACRIAGFRDLLRHQTQPEITFASEIAGRIRVIACIDDLPNFSHELHVPMPTTLEGRPVAFGNSSVASHTMLPDETWKNLRELLECGENDAVAMAWGNPTDLVTALNEIMIRCQEAVEIIPGETRQAFSDGTTDFERILPGADRMYPDTDSPPIPISPERLEKLSMRVPERSWEKEVRYLKLGLNMELSQDLSVSARSSLFDRIVKEIPGIDPVAAAVTLTHTYKSLRREDNDPTSIPEDKIFDLFKGLADDLYTEDAVPSILAWLAGHPDLSVTDAIAATGLGRINGDELRKETDRILSSATIPEILNPPKRKRYVAGILMDELRGRAKWHEIESAIDDWLKM